MRISLSAIVSCSLLAAVQPHAQANLRPTDPRIKTELVSATETRKAGEPIVADVYIQNLERADIRKNQFSPVSSSVGLPSFHIVKVPQGDEILLSPGGFATAPEDWDSWYQPASGRDADRVGAFIVPAGARVHLLHGDLRRMVREQGEYCRQHLARDTLLEKAEEAATKKYYQDVVRFARLFAEGGAFDLTVWAYSRSNTVRIQVEPTVSCHVD